MIKLKSFRTEELVSPEIYRVCGEDSLKLYDPMILEGADTLAKFFGPMICNTWHDEKLSAKYGFFTNRGLRALNSSVGARESAHKLGIDRKGLSYGAIDLHPIKVSVITMHNEIESNQDFWSKWFTRVEKCTPDGRSITWFHGDNKPHTFPERIRFFKP